MTEWIYKNETGLGLECLEKCGKELLAAEDCIAATPATTTIRGPLLWWPISNLGGGWIFLEDKATCRPFLRDIVTAEPPGPAKSWLERITRLVPAATNPHFYGIATVKVLEGTLWLPSLSTLAT